ncbi:hypothetical protein HZS_1738 [Henneguya salminicola]|nr:hypothetical protein HZS_1738 [Henneguya salminicola]
MVILQINKPYLQYIKDFYIIELQDKFWCIILKSFEHSLSDSLSLLETLKTDLNSIYDEITNLYDCSDLTAKYLNEIAINRLRNKIELQRSYPDLFLHNNDQFIENIKQLNKLVYYNSLNDIIEDQILRTSSNFN